MVIGLGIWNKWLDLVIRQEKILWYFMFIQIVVFTLLYLLLLFYGFFIIYDKLEFDCIA